MKRRFIGAALAAAAILAVIPSVASARARPAPGPLAGTDAFAAGMKAEADLLEAKIADHMVADQVVEVDYATAAKAPGTVVATGGWGDSGLWTGTYLAAQSFRYALAKQKLSARSRLNRGERDAWTAHRDQALARVKQMVGKYHLLVNIGETWEEKFNPSVNPSNTRSPASFGGGIVRGEKGMLMRACSPTDLPEGIGVGNNQRVWTLPSDPNATYQGKRWKCETAPSRDTYAGTTFGLLTAFDLALGDDPALRAQVKDDILTLGNFLVKYQWNFPRPHGNISAPPTGHDFDNFISPLFVYVPAARLNLTQAARHVAAVAGTADEQARWNGIWQQELATQGPMYAPSMEVDAIEPNAGYYKFNLHHLTGFNVVRLEHNAAAKASFMQAMGVMDKTTGDDINAHFETVTYALTGEQSRLNAALNHLSEWRDYRANIEAAATAGRQTDNSAVCSTPGACVPKDQLNIMIGGADVPVPRNPTSASRARKPLPVAVRPPTDFLWQREPTQLKGGPDGAGHEAPGIDFLLPYWMLRYYTEIATPALNPFPAWAGPAHE